ncbi:hypothetical protein [Streptococcus suis]|uniref:hypothetical protein n=1 Tax=Streptococcus suis TaxID=1307 RepID=UPI000CF4AABD|nr:hypothetical protein [Streptococcus suis]
MIRLSRLSKIIVTMSALIMLGVDRLFPVEVVGTYYQRIFIIFSAIVIWFLMQRYSTLSLKEETRFLNRYFLLYIFVIAIATTMSVFKYGYSLEIVAKNILSLYSLPLIAYTIVLIFHDDQSPVPFLSLLSKIVLIMLAIRMFSWGMFNFRGITFFPRLLLQYEGWIRDGFQRVEAGMLIGVVLSYLTVQSLQKNTRGLLSKIAVAFIILFLLVVTRARFQTMLALVSVFFTYYFNQVQTRKGHVLKIALICLVGITLLLNYQMIESLFSIISTNGQYGGSTLVRFTGVEHFLTLMKQQSAYFGLGFLIKGGASVVDAMLLQNQWRSYYLDDFGMFGTIFQLGLFVLVTHVILFIKAIQLLLKCRNLEDRSYFNFLLCLTIYLIGSNIILNMFDSQRIFDVPFYLAIYSFLDSRINQVKVRER